MPTPQTPADIEALVRRTLGLEIIAVEVFAPNALKSFSPSLNDLRGEVITGLDVSERGFSLYAGEFTMLFDLQRTGQIAWRNDALSAGTIADVGRPTIRLSFVDESRMELTEPAKTKRISLAVSKP